MKTRNEILKLAFIQADTEDYAALSTDSFEWTPSPAFEKKMEKLIRHRKNPLWKYINTAGKKVAVIVLAIVVLMGSALSVEAIREPVFKFFVETYEKFTVIFFDKQQTASAPETIETKFIPESIPEGYSLLDVTDDMLYREMIYTNKIGQKLILSQCTITDSKFTANTEGAVLLPLKIDDNEGFYYVNKGEMVLFWKTNKYAFRLTVADDFSLEEAVAIAESVKPENNELFSFLCHPSYRL